MIRRLFFAQTGRPVYQPTAKVEKSAKAVKTEKKGEIAANSDQYIIGPEDVLNIFVWKEEQMTKTVPVRIDGMISLPLVDDITGRGTDPA